MRSLGTRLARLEARQVTAIGPVTILRTMVEPGAAGPRALPLLALRSGAQRWRREAGEAEQDFIERAKREVTRNERGVAALVQDETEGQKGNCDG